MYEMKDEYYIGVEAIDKQHKELFHIADEAYMLLKDEFIVDKFDEIVAIIGKLKDYAAQHFADEEAYMLSIGHKKFFSQKAEHTEFLEKIDSIDFENMDRNQLQALVDILEFLNDWLVHHILEKDKLLSPDIQDESK
ncbi:bacteriohemerythrin [Candidatus Galacturonibacter soehngenii]|uniref:Bacteriohemerythrin n=1 Tax=Candidatus Galacturonatibacter soehngenii TaxID=2307010 RepID=A0A7V7UBR4_9FIRM|nr:hemerythrin family protein [Candidatus Galacturonibacter soehngenii]KAB1438045.1 bacteriohemerythrin [Candidatus Galacturonibacter soehngenii]MBA4688778.1 hemerythrin family protein [Candidatus Galacturonibacter soehngenii]